MIKTTNEEIMLCGPCKGTGLLQNSELEDYHNGTYRYWNTVCRTCKGLGRLKKVVVTETEITPYDNAEVTLLLLKETDDK